MDKDLVSGIYSKMKGVWLKKHSYVYIAASGSYDAFVIDVSGFNNGYLLDMRFYVSMFGKKVTRDNNGINTMVGFYWKDDNQGICIEVPDNIYLFVGVSYKNNIRLGYTLESGYTLQLF